jgi:hypothetical protein
VSACSVWTPALLRSLIPGRDNMPRVHRSFTRHGGATCENSATGFSSWLIHKPRPPRSDMPKIRRTCRSLSAGVPSTVPLKPRAATGYPVLFLETMWTPRCRSDGSDGLGNEGMSWGGKHEGPSVYSADGPSGKTTDSGTYSVRLLRLFLLNGFNLQLDFHRFTDHEAALI